MSHNEFGYNKFYCLTSLDYMLDLHTFKLAPIEAITDRDVVGVPIYMSSYSGYTKLHEVFRHASPDHRVRLNQLEVQLISRTVELKPFGFGKHVAKVSFFDTIDKEDKELELSVAPYFGSSAAFGLTKSYIEGVNYTIRTDNRIKRIRMDITPEDTQHFFSIDNLPHVRTQHPEMRDIFNFGVDYKQYEVVYRDKKMNGTCYAMLCGSWGILLDDNMMLDAIVLLNTVKEGYLGVEHFIYVANTYITKFITLSGSKR